MSKTYTLPYTLKAPCEETEHMYLAEVPVLPGCRAWGETAEEALRNLDGVAADFVASHEEHGDELPSSIAAAGELVIAV
ncbi:type II toxin-antitoxin system HicB family antitoxin [Candidatus Poriferisodalis sp.]|uniref:type II toxin-antitoxin system HicB family antitoxin n=1 Tax=Candidatus Poriferisodalis sp. TaxID=3101277 RepID=UPI003B023CFE